MSDLKLVRCPTRKTGRSRQFGLSLLEVMMSVAIIGGILGFALYYQSKAKAGMSGNSASTNLALMASTIKNVVGSSNSYATLTPATLDNIGGVPKGFVFDGTNVIDPWGNTMSVSGATATFALTVGGATQPLSKDTCTSIASRLADDAMTVRVGAATASAGVIAGGSAYKAIGGVPDVSLLGTGCATANPVIAAQFR